MGGDFQQYRANVGCGRSGCLYTASLGIYWSFITFLKYKMCTKLNWKNNNRDGAEQSVAFPLFEMRFRLHRHQQGGGSPAAAPENGLDSRRRIRKVHSVAKLSRRQLPALQQANALPLPQVLLRRSRPGSNVSSQVPPSRIVDSVSLTPPSIEIICLITRLRHDEDIRKNKSDSNCVRNF